jgi:FkbM family methyltransferase
MFQTIKYKVENLVSSIRNPNYREFIRLLLKYGDSERNKPHQIKFLNYDITVPDTLSFIFQFKEIFVNESYKFESSKDSQVIYDCGANIGISCLFFKKIFPSSRIIAFEADPEIAKILQDNLDRNQIKNITVISKAVWKDNNGVEFGTGFADAGSIYNSVNKIRVESVRLRDMIEKEEKIDMLKIDIEGAEVGVLNDCKESLSNVQNLFIEYHEWKGFSQKLDEILSILSQNEFEYFIEPITKIHQPFVAKKIHNSNFQLNIFAEKISNANK